MPWVKGQSGNANGRVKGRRVRITERFLKDLECVWRDEGEAALRKAAQEEPAQFAGIVVKLLPRDTHVSVTHELSSQFIAAIRNANLALPTTGSADTINGSAEHIADEAKPLTPLDTQRSKDMP